MLLKWLQAHGSRAETQQYLLGTCCLWASLILDTDSHGFLMMKTLTRYTCTFPTLPTPLLPPLPAPQILLIPETLRALGPIPGVIHSVTFYDALCFLSAKLPVGTGLVKSFCCFLHLTNAGKHVFFSLKFKILTVPTSRSDH